MPSQVRAGACSIPKLAGRQALFFRRLTQEPHPGPALNSSCLFSDNLSDRQTHGGGFFFGDHFVNIESFNENTGKGWTDQEEATFASIMRIARMSRIAAIQFFRRCRSDHAKALKLAQGNYGLSDAQKAAYESTRAARLAGLSKRVYETKQGRTRPIYARVLTVMKVGLPSSVLVLRAVPFCTVY
jgi:hypothetical protein